MEEIDIKAKEIEAARQFLIYGPRGTEEDRHRGRAKHVDPHPHIPVITGDKGFQLIKSLGKFRATHSENSYIVTKYSKRSFHIDVAVGTFYTLQGMVLKFMDKPPTTKRETRLFMDIRAHLNVITETMAGAIHDYMCMASWGEARHSWRAAELVHPFIPSSPGRSAVGAESTLYDPDEFKPVVEKLFKFGKWGGGAFGGWNWGRIAEIANMYGKVDNIIFIDFSVGLSHNGGLQFSKPFLIEYSSNPGTLRYRPMLDAKRDKNLVDYVGIHGGSYDSLPIAVDPPTKDYVDRGATLNLWPSSKFFRALGNLQRVPVEWGKAHFPQFLIDLGEDRRSMCENCAKPFKLCSHYTGAKKDSSTSTNASSLFTIYSEASNTDSDTFHKAMHEYIKVAGKSPTQASKTPKDSKK